MSIFQLENRQGIVKFRQEFVSAAKKRISEEVRLIGD
jgi:hypothetical protein